MGAADEFGSFIASWLSFLLVSLSSASVANVFAKSGLPLITIYMFFGCLVGPAVLDLLTQEDLPHLGYITQVALSFISLSAGSELYLPELKALFKRITTITAITAAITFFATFGGIWALADIGLIPFMNALNNPFCEMSVSLIGASIMVTQSPSSAIAVVKDMRAKGPFTSTFLGVVVLTDVLVLIIFSIVSSVANASCNPLAQGFQVVELLLTLLFIATSGVLGWVMGKIIIFFIWLPRISGEWLVLPLGFTVFQFSSWFLDFSTAQWHHGINFDPLLICITAGYIVSNQSHNRRKFLRFLGKAGPIVFIPFFTLTGAGLKLKVIFQSIPFAFIMFFMRAGCFFIGSWYGGKRTGMPHAHRETMWLALLTQSGVSLGIVAEVSLAFSEWGTQFASTMISVIVINQIVGPVACGWALRRNDEDAKSLIDEDEDERKVRRCVIVGVNHDSLGLGQRLINIGWNVLYLDVDETKFDLLRYLHVPARKRSDAKPPQSPSFNPQQPKEAIEGQLKEIPLDLSSPNEGGPLQESVSSTTLITSSSSSAADDERIQQRVIVPVMDGVPVDDKQHRALSMGVQNALSDVTDANAQCAVLMLDSDSEMFALCNLFLEQFHLSRVIVQTRNPNWAPMFASIGVLPLFPFSSNVSLLFEAVVTGPNQHLEVVKPSAPLHVGLAGLVKPDTTQDIPLNQFGSSADERAEFLRLYPDPPLPHDQLWRFNEKVRVVPQAVREEYLSQIYGVHKNSFDMKTMQSVNRGRATFMGPSMMQDEDEARLHEHEEELALADLEDEEEPTRIR